MTDRSAVAVEAAVTADPDVSVAVLNGCVQSFGSRQRVVGVLIHIATTWLSYTCMCIDCSFC